MPGPRFHLNSKSILNSMRAVCGRDPGVFQCLLHSFCVIVEMLMLAVGHAKADVAVGFTSALSSVAEPFAEGENRAALVF